MINGEQRSNGPSVSLPTMDTGPSPSIGWWKLAEETRQQYEDGTYRAPEDGRSKNPQVDEYYFERMEDRTNVDGLMAYWMRVLHQAEWFDAEGNPAETGPMDEVAAIVNSTLQTMAENATSSQGFLINLAALAGAKSLMNTRQKCFRLHYDQTHNYYRFEWDYRFGHIQGTFDMATSVPRSMYERPGAVRHDGPGAASGVGLSTQEWQNKYSSLLGEVEKRERELAELRARMTVSDNEDA